MVAMVKPVYERMRFFKSRASSSILLFSPSESTTNGAHFLSIGAGAGGTLTPRDPLPSPLQLAIFIDYVPAMSLGTIKREHSDRWQSLLD